MRQLLLALALAGCTANAGVRGLMPASQESAATLPAGGVPTGTLTFQIDIPFASQRTAHFISPSTRSAAFVLYPLSKTNRVTARVNLTAATNPHCRALDSIETLRCTVTLHPQVGRYRASIATFDRPLGANGVPTGHKLSANDTLPVYVPPYGVKIALAIYLNGIPRSVLVSAPLAGSQSAGFSLNPCQRFPQIFTVNALDADGEIIVGAGAPTATLRAGAGILVSPTDRSTPNEFEVDADPNTTPGTATLTATMTANGVAGKHSRRATVTVSTSPVSPHGCLVVGNGGPIGGVGNVAFFAPGATAPALTVTGHIGGPYAFAFDAQKHLYVDNSLGNTVTEYDENSMTPIQTFPADEPLAIALDTAGNLYVASSVSNEVSVFAPNTATPSYEISVQSPQGLAFDSSGNLYVVSSYVPTAGSGTVTEYAPGGTTAIKTMTIGNFARGLAFDHAGNLFVVNDDSIMAFAPGAMTPSYTITDSAVPEQIAFDSSNDLYVANNKGTVKEYAPGQTTPSKTLSTGLYTSSVMVDSADELYVGASKHVWEYAPGSSTPSLKVSDGISDASALALTP